MTTLPTPPAVGTFTLQARDGEVSWIPGTPVVTPPVVEKPLRAAFYYPWFPGAWNQAGYSQFTNFHPSLGYYSSSDSKVINAHIAAMKYGGMDAGIISWWGQKSREDAVVSSLLAAATGTTFKWCLYYEMEGTSDPTVAQITADLEYIKAYTKHINYLKMYTKPVIFVYGGGGDAAGMVARWKQADIKKEFYIVLKVFNGYQALDKEADNWHQYAPAAATDHQPGHSFTISPGFYKKGESNPRLARDPVRWISNVDAMLASKEPLQLITTFNEWGEGSSVESAVEWQSPTGFGLYLDVLHKAIMG
jgi:Glycosyl hydrolase family 99